MNFKNILACTLTASLLTIPHAGRGASISKADYELYINGTQIENSSQYLSDDKVMIPLRIVCENLGMEVNWNEETNKISIEKLPVFITCSPEKDGYTIAKTAPMLLGTAPILVDDTTYVPISFVDEILQGSATIEANRIDISYGNAEGAEDGSEEESKYNDVICISKADNELQIYDAKLGMVNVNITEETKLSGINLNDIKEGKEFNIVYSDAMTLSLPPIANAIEISAKENASYEVVEGSIFSTEKTDSALEQIIIGEEDPKTQTVFNIAENTAVLHADGSLADLSAISDDVKEIKVIASAASTRSLPPQKAAYVIIIK